MAYGMGKSTKKKIRETIKRKKAENLDIQNQQGQCEQPPIEQAKAMHVADDSRR